jgi:hypothetical protein
MIIFDFLRIKSPEELRMGIANNTTIKIYTRLPGSRYSGGE